MIARRSSPAAKRSQPRRRVVPFWRTRTALVAGGALVAGVAGGLGWLAWQQGLPQRLAGDAAQAMIRGSSHMGFAVRDVFVVGRESTPKGALLDALAVRRGGAILAVDLEAARNRLQALPWVREASVRRVLPDTIVVEIVERRPLALWQYQKKFALIDEEGQVILRDDVGPFNKLMVVVGEDAPANATALVRMLASEPDMMSRVKAAVRVGGRRWNVHLADGIDIKLPEQDPAQAWRRLAEYQRAHGVLDKDVRVLDLRFPDRLVIQPGEPSAEGKTDNNA